MADNAGKLFFQDSLNRVAIRRATEAISQLGQALPCRVVAVNGSIVTVAFEVTNWPQTLPNITIPKAESQWLRAPTQVGDFGLTVPSDASLGGINGFGGGVAGTAKPFNFGALIWIPVASKSFGASPNNNAAWINGPDGAILSDTEQTASVTVSNNLVTIKAGGKTWTFSATGFTMDTGIVAETHQHLYTPGTGTPTDTGPPVA